MSREQNIVEIAARVIAEGLDVSAAAAMLVTDTQGTVTLDRAQHLIGAQVQRQQLRAMVEEDSRRNEWYLDLAQGVVEGARTIGDVAAELKTDPDTAAAVLAVVDPRMAAFEKVDLTASTVANSVKALVDSYELGAADRERGGVDASVLADRRAIVTRLAAQAAIAVNNPSGPAATRMSRTEAAPDQGGGHAADGGQAGRRGDRASPARGGEATRKRG